MLVCRALARSEDTYFIFRNDSTQVEVILREGKIYKVSTYLTDEEHKYFKDGKHKELNYL